MFQRPPPRLIDLLARLGLANEAQVVSLGGRAARLARGLPTFESVWIDALAQARVLTHFQAEQINAGRGEQLRVGAYVLCRPVDWPHFAAGYLAREIPTGHPVRLTLIEASAARKIDILAPLEALAARAGDLEHPALAPVTCVGAEGKCRFVISRWVEGLTPAEWLVRQGRTKPEIVLEVARQMLAGLVLLEQRGLCHGDIGAGSLILTHEGQAVLLQPGLRAIVRPEEGFAQVDLRPEAYDYLAPERVAEGRPPTVRSDAFSCGALWWHMLAGRPPLGTGGAIHRMRAGQEGRIPELAQFVPNVPRRLAEAIAACLSRDATRRPESMARLANVLGTSGPSDRRTLARSLSGAERPSSVLVRSARQATTSSRGSAWITAAAVALVVIGTLTATFWQFTRPRRGDSAAIARGVVSSSATPVVSGNMAQASSAPSPTSSHAPEPAKASGPADLVLEPGAVRWPAARLLPGQKVRGSSGERTQVQVPSEGLRIDVDHLQVEDVDFVGAGQKDLGPPPALIRLQAEGAQFRGCTFQGPATRVAIAWQLGQAESASALSMPSGRVRLVNCVIHGVDTALDCRSRAAMAVELDNVLHVEAGPLVRLNDCPSVEETLVVVMSQVTLRESGPLVECRYEQIGLQPGAITIRANECVAWLAANAGLLAFVGPERPDRILAVVRWTGQGSLVGPAVPLAVWQRAEGDRQPLDESALAMHGLVRSEAAFVGAPQAGPAASRLTRWQVPLRSPDPPGIDPVGLPGGH